MGITPRKDEVEGVVSLLESDEFDDAGEMAKAIIKLVADVLSQRTTHGVAVGMPGCKPALAVGPFYTVRDARKCVSDAQEAGMEARTHRLSGAGSIRAAQALRAVCVCGHRTESHVWTTCTIAGCGCAGVNFEEGN